MFFVKVAVISIPFLISVPIFILSFLELASYFGDRKIKLYRENGICKEEFEIFAICFVAGTALVAYSVVLYFLLGTSV